MVGGGSSGFWSGTGNWYTFRGGRGALNGGAKERGGGGGACGTAPPRAVPQKQLGLPCAGIPRSLDFREFGNSRIS